MTSAAPLIAAWRLALRAQQAGSDTPRAPALRIVSFNADATNRGPTFDMDLSELVRPPRLCW